MVHSSGTRAKDKTTINSNNTGNLTWKMLICSSTTHLKAPSKVIYISSIYPAPSAFIGALQPTIIGCFSRKKDFQGRKFRLGKLHIRGNYYNVSPCSSINVAMRVRLITFAPIIFLFFVVFICLHKPRFIEGCQHMGVIWQI